jgi:hypothetical protein
MNTLFRERIFITKVPLKSRGNQFDTGLQSFHGFSIDVEPERSYSEPIYGKDLVPIANSKLRLPHLIGVVFTTLNSAPQLLTINSRMLTAPKASIGGYFSA